MITRLALAALVLAHTAVAHEFIRVRALSRTSTALVSAATTSTAAVAVNSSLAAVCTPAECIQGVNSLTGTLLPCVPRSHY